MKIIVNLVTIHLNMRQKPLFGLQCIAIYLDWLSDYNKTAMRINGEIVSTYHSDNPMQ